MITRKAQEWIDKIYWKLWCLNPINEVSLVELYKRVKPIEEKEYTITIFEPIEKDTSCIIHIEEQPVMVNIDRRTKQWKNKVKNMKKLGWEYNKKSDSFIKKWTEELG